MFTKVFEMARSMSKICNNKNVGMVEAKTARGETRYIGPQTSGDATYPYTNLSQLPSGQYDSGIHFSDVYTPFVDDGSVYSYPPVSGLSGSMASQNNTYSISEGKLYVTARCTLANSTASDITLYKIFGISIIPSSASLGGTIYSTGSSTTFLSFVEELASPIVVPANGSAIVDITVETEIPE